MCEGNGKKTTILLHSQGRFFPKTETNASCFLWRQSDRSEVPGKFLKAMLEKVGEAQLDRSFEKCKVLHRVKEKRNIVHTVKRRKANWICHILRRKCLVKHFIEGKVEGRIEVMRRRRRRHMQLLGNLKETREYWTLKEEALDRILWSTPWTCFKTNCIKKCPVRQENYEEKRRSGKRSWPIVNNRQELVWHLYKPRGSLDNAYCEMLPGSK
jgi:hypothetical protein